MEKTEQHEYGEHHHQIEGQLCPCDCHSWIAGQFYGSESERPKKGKKEQHAEDVETEIRHCYPPCSVLHLDVGAERSCRCSYVCTNYDRNRRCHRHQVLLHKQDAKPRGDAAGLNDCRNQEPGSDACQGCA